MYRNNELREFVKELREMGITVKSSGNTYECYNSNGQVQFTLKQRTTSKSCDVFIKSWKQDDYNKYEWVNRTRDWNELKSSIKQYYK